MLRMRCLLAAPLLVVVLAVCPAQSGYLSDFVSQLEAAFKSYEEAPYELTKAGPGYEERLYAPTTWVCKTETDNPHVGNDLSLLFWPLFNYISGQNAREEKITMTAPVATKFMVRSSTDKTYEMCFYLGSTHQQNPPQPFPASGVVIQSRPEMRVVTRTVGGYIYHEEGWMEEAGRLAGILQEGGITVNLSQMYWVGYDSPMKFWNRRNEIWFPIEN